MMKFPDEQAFREKVRQAMLNNDEAAMGKAWDEYAAEVARSGQITGISKESMIREIRGYMREMFSALDAQRDQAS